jgi:hypothetical protein
MINRRFQIAAGTAVAAAAVGVVSGGTASAATAQDGWIRLAHLSPNTPPVDVYLYAFGGTSAQTVLKHVAYGTASPYESLPQGLYTVAMRAAGADSSSPPVISTNVEVKAGAAYTVAGLGPYANLSLSVLNDQLNAPAGKAGVRIIEASLQNPSVRISAGSGVLTDALRFPAVTGYRTVTAGSWDVSVKTDSTSATAQVNLHTGSTYTLAVLDGAGNSPRVLSLPDSTGSAEVPKGGVAAGYGGMASGRGLFDAQEAELMWGGLLIAGAAGIGISVRRLRRF